MHLFFTQSSRKILFFFILILSSTHLIHSRETDNFTYKWKIDNGRVNPLPDAGSILDDFVNYLLDIITSDYKNLNAKSPASLKTNFKRHLYQILQNGDERLHPYLRGTRLDPFIEKWPAASDELMGHLFFFSPARSIHFLRIEAMDSNQEQEWQRTDPLIRRMILRSYGVSPILILHGHEIGVDKLAHFFIHGYEYLQHFQDDGDVFEYGHNQESGLFGMQTTKVYSFADLEANFQGFLFWRALFQKYLTIQDGSVKKIRDFTFKNYVSPFWDESINCSNFCKDSGTHNTYTANLDFYQMTCPSNKNFCYEASRILDQLGNSERIESRIHPNCLKLDRK